MLPLLSNFYNLTNPEYLEANQRGEITPEQAALLGPAGSKFFKKFQRGSKLNGIAVVLVLVFFLVVQAVGIEISTPFVLGAFGLLLVVLAVQVGGRWTRARRQSSLLKEDLERGVIHDAVGSLHLGKDAFTIVLSGRELHLPLGSKEGLSPGVSYRFYYLPESGVVLSAEVLDDLPAQKAIDGLTAILVEANGFHLASLSANQRGEMAREQLSLLYRGLVSPLIFTFVLGGILVYQLSRAGIFSGTSLAEIFANLKGMSTGLLVFGGILAALSMWGLVLLIQTVMDIAGGQVASVEDVGYRQMTRSSDEDGTTTTRLYLIGGYKFRVQQRGFAAFEDGKTYRAYFTPRRKTLVNIEVVG
jgi:hypothetical protein